MSSSLRYLPLLVGLLVLPSSAMAHRLDEYLQATLVSIEPVEVRLQINLTPGVEVADRVLAVVDRDGDGVVSTNEASAYCELFKRELVVRLDGRKLALKAAPSSFPAVTELRTGWGIIQVEFWAAVGPLAPGAHRLAIENHHLRALSVYLLNAAPPKSGLVRITKQRRNKTQSTGEIEFTIERQPGPGRAALQGRLPAAFYRVPQSPGKSMGRGWNASLPEFLPFGFGFGMLFALVPTTGDMQNRPDRVS